MYGGPLENCSAISQRLSRLLAQKAVSKTTASQPENSRAKALGLTVPPGLLVAADEVIAKIYQIVETVPLPATLPPVTIGDFNRIDCVTEIRGLPSVFLEHSSQMLSKQQLRPATQ